MRTTVNPDEQASKEERQQGGAEPALRAIPAEDTANAGSLHALGLSAMQEQDFELAAAKFAQAIRIAGPVAQYCQSLARALHGSGKLRQSATCYEQAIAGEPGNVDLYFGLARVLIQDGRTAVAATVLERALALTPGSAEGWALLGGALSLSGLRADAAEALQRAISLDPGQARFHHDLGLVLSQLGDLEKSEAAYRRALRINARFPEALNNLGNLLLRRDAAAEAVGYFRRALRHRPDYGDAKYNLGLTFQALDLLEDAESCYLSVLQTAPAHHAASNNYGNVLMGQGRVHEALPSYAQAIRLAPANREYRVNLGMAQLLDGKFSEGWDNYGARVAPSVSGTVLWTGQPFKGQSILLLSEQGLGDTIQFIRYARRLRDEGGRVLALCPEPLVELLRTVTGIERVIPAGRKPPSCDWYAPLLHLPKVFGTSVESIPAEAPYVLADPDRVRSWGMSLAAPEAMLRVGIAWRGGAEHWNDRNRSLDSALLTELAGIPGIAFISLQKGCRNGREGLPFIPLHRELTDFADTAALMAHLDLVISVDTSVAHLAGAMGRPAWVLLPFAPDWRWMRERSDSPWYPGMRLFRQERRGKWRPVLKEVREALVCLAGSA
jgi:tetratricopeptide (TPR) repeat protein